MAGRHCACPCRRRPATWRRTFTRTPYGRGKPSAESLENLGTLRWQLSWLEAGVEDEMS